LRKEVGFDGLELFTKPSARQLFGSPSKSGNDKPS